MCGADLWYGQFSLDVCSRDISVFSWWRIIEWHWSANQKEDVLIHPRTHTDPVSIIHQTDTQADDETTLTLRQTVWEMEMDDSRMWGEKDRWMIVEGEGKKTDGRAEHTCHFLVTSTCLWRFILDAPKGIETFVINLVCRSIAPSCCTFYSATMCWWSFFPGVLTPFLLWQTVEDFPLRCYKLGSVI